MATLKIPVVIDGVKTIEELANRVLDEYEYQGRTIREWADRIAHPETNADLIRAMTDEELAEIIPDRVDCSECPARIGDYRSCKAKCKEIWLNWLRQEAE